MKIVVCVKQVPDSDAALGAVRGELTALQRAHDTLAKELNTARASLGKRETQASEAKAALAATRDELQVVPVWMSTARST